MIFIISCSLCKQLLCVVYCEFINYVTSWWCGLRSAMLSFHKLFQVCMHVYSQQGLVHTL